MGGISSVKWLSGTINPPFQPYRVLGSQGARRKEGVEVKVAALVRGGIKVAVVGLDRKGGQLRRSLQRRRKAARENIAPKLKECWGSERQGEDGPEHRKGEVKLKANKEELPGDSKGDVCAPERGV